MPERWYQQGVVYCLDVETFQDSNGDGVGDLPGPDQPAGLPGPARGEHASGSTRSIRRPDRDDGYDVTDYYGVDPRLGSLGDFVELVHQCENRGHPADDRPGRQPHLRRAPLVPVRPVRARTRRTGTGTSGRRPSRRTRRRASSSPATSAAPGRTTRRRKPGTTTASTTSSPTSTGPTRGPGGDRQGGRLLAAARGERLPDGRRAVRHRGGAPGLGGPDHALRVAQRPARPHRLAAR